MKFNCIIIRPSSKEYPDLLHKNIDDIKSFFKVRYKELTSCKEWPYTASSIKNRFIQLNKALLDKKNNFIWCARGGYGASDLLPYIYWKKLKNIRPKLIIGFSDISALHCAFYTKLGWCGLHAPMPATALWAKNGDKDIQQVFNILTSDNEYVESNIKIKLLNQNLSNKLSNNLQGKLFGGCLSVLSNLIGTEYFPSSLKNHIIFFEDTDEIPPKIIRNLNQWLHAGYLYDATAIVFGVFRGLSRKEQKLLHNELQNRLKGIPLFYSSDFGHISPNFPLMIGANAQIINNKILKWKCKNFFKD